MSPLSAWILAKSCKVFKTRDEEIVWSRSAITELAESVTMETAAVVMATDVF